MDKLRRAGERISRDTVIAARRCTVALIPTGGDEETIERCFELSDGDALIAVRNMVRTVERRGD